MSNSLEITHSKKVQVTRVDMFKQNAETNKKWSVYFIPFQLLAVAEKKATLLFLTKCPFRSHFVVVVSYCYVGSLRQTLAWIRPFDNSSCSSCSTCCDYLFSLNGKFDLVNKSRHERSTVNIYLFRFEKLILIEGKCFV